MKVKVPNLNFFVFVSHTQVALKVENAHPCILILDWPIIFIPVIWALKLTKPKEWKKIIQLFRYLNFSFKVILIKTQFRERKINTVWYHLYVELKYDKNKVI